jgi:catechol 2,3-dioxygenase-like lactoylglutathione lyase family enzyme
MRKTGSLIATIDFYPEFPSGKRAVMRLDNVLLVENLDVCRYFYRTSLGLGEPVIDTNYLAVFATHDGGSLILEKNPAAYLAHASAPGRIVLHVDDPEALAEKLKSDGITVEKGFSLFFEDVLRTGDPEGNIIWLVR